MARDGMDPRKLGKLDNHEQNESAENPARNRAIMAREVHVDAEDQRWLDFMRYVEAIPNVLVVGWRNGAQIARFEPGRSQPLDPLVARFYERHL